MTDNISTPEKRNVMLNGKRTTLQLERYIWQNLNRIATKTDRTVQDILDDVWQYKVDMAMAPSVRLFLMLFFTDYAERFPQRYVQTPHLDDDPSDGSAIYAAEPPPDNASQSYEHALLTLEVIAIKSESER